MLRKGARIAIGLGLLIALWLPLEAAALRNGLPIVVTVGINSSGNMLLNTWQISEDGNVTPIGGIGQIGVEEASLAYASPNYVAVGARETNGCMLLIAYEIQADGHPRRTSTQTTPYLATGAVSTAFAEENLVVTVYRTNYDFMNMVLWEIDANGMITILSDAPWEEMGQLGEASEIKLVSLGDGLLALVFRNNEGNLQVSTWEIAGEELIFKHTLKAQKVTKISASTIDTSALGWYKGLVTASRDGSGNLYLTSWEVLASGSLAVRNHGAGRGIGDTSVTSCRFDDGTACAAIGVVDDTGSLHMYAYQIAPDGDFTYMGDLRSLSVSQIDATYVDNQMITASITPDRQGMVTTWRIISNNQVGMRYFGTVDDLLSIEVTAMTRTGN